MLKIINRYIFESKNDWAEIRKDLFTASRINEIMANAKRLMTPDELIQWVKDNPKSKAKYTEDENGISDGAITYILEIIQRLEGAPKPEYHSFAMDWGNETEPLAAIKYCEMNGFDIESDDVIYTSIGGTVFFTGDDLLGATPDLILPNKVAQIKCPESSTHLRYKLFLNEDNFRDEEPKYYDQVQLEMMLCEKDECDFFSYDPRFKREVMQTHTIQIKKDADRQNQIYRKAKLCKEKMNEFINQLPK